jgi:delta 1-pyrroline-5-carboxylate dehydrogenase
MNAAALQCNLGFLSPGKLGSDSERVQTMPAFPSSRRLNRLRRPTWGPSLRVIRAHRTRLGNSLCRDMNTPCVELPTELMTRITETLQTLPRHQYRIGLFRF